MERLPSRIFVVNYIKAYASVIGMSPEEAVLRYEEVDKSVPAPSPVQLEQERRKRAYVTPWKTRMPMWRAILSASPTSSKPAAMPGWRT